jgi:3',5'-cyclic-AMP phosphodiesterase
LGKRPDAIGFNGDLAGKGQSEAYRRFREAVKLLAAQLNAQLVRVMDNHDNGTSLRRFLSDGAPSMAPLDRVRSDHAGPN